MRILYIDIDSLRHDHLGCYGYHRNTSPNIDALAQYGVRFNNVYASDAPCLPSRTALNTGRFGIHTGVCNHHGSTAELFVEGPPRRQFESELGRTSWAECLRKAGWRTVTFSPFAKRHSAWWWYAGFEEMHAYGSPGTNQAHEDQERVRHWLEHNGKNDGWFLHLNFWDVHFPFRTPQEYGNPFADDPPPSWYTEEVRQTFWDGVGITSAQDLEFSRGKAYAPYPRQPSRFDSMDAVKSMFDGYDTALRYVDDHVGKILQQLDELGVREETAIIISSDHGECLGELNIHCDHRLADEYTHHIPLIIDWPGITDQAHSPRIDDALRYHLDLGASVLKWAGAEVPENWDGVSFARSENGNTFGVGRDFLVCTYGGCCSVQRAVRFSLNSRQFYCIRSYHDGWHCLPDILLFDLESDPHLQRNLAEAMPEATHLAMYYLTQWESDMMRTATHPMDPIWIALAEGCQDLVLPGPELKPNPHFLSEYLRHLEATGRKRWADEIRRKHF